VMRLWIERLNGVPNAPTASGPQREFAPDFVRFQRIAYLLQLAQDRELAIIFPEQRETAVGGPIPGSLITAAAMTDAAKNGMEYRPQGNGTTWALTRKESNLVIQVNPTAIDDPVVEELTALLNLRPGLDRYDVVVATDNADPLRFPREPSADLRLTPRSTAQVQFYLANGVDVPPEHIAAGLVRQPRSPDGCPFDSRAITAGLFAVQTARGHKPPANAYVSIRYRDYWYFIDERDQATKATFELILQLSRLDFGLQETTAAPFLTLPVGR
jgi:hypothetical protein